LKEERDTLKMFENGVLRSVFETERDEVAGDWRRQRDELCTNYTP
jgi:hypothetical protein